MRVLLVSLALLTAAFADAGEDSKADLKKMEGTWKAVLGEVDGKPPGDKEKEASFKIVVKEGKFSAFFGDKLLTQGTLKLNAEKKEIDANQTDGPFKGMDQKGLYEIKGDEMRIVWAEPGQDRPASFKTEKGQVLLLYTRLKDKK